MRIASRQVGRGLGCEDLGWLLGLGFMPGKVRAIAGLHCRALAFDAQC